MEQIRLGYETVRFMFVNFYHKTLGPCEFYIKTVLLAILCLVITGHNVISWVKAQTGVDFWQAVKEGGDKEGMIENDFKDVQKSHTNSSKKSSAWARSSEKGYLGYYVAHQNQTGGYKDGLKGDDYAMNGPKKIDDERAKKIVDNLKGKSKGELEDRPENVRARAEKPPVHSTTLPEDPGTKILKYSWEDGEDNVKMYLDVLPGYDSWLESGVQKEGISTYWDDRQSLLVLVMKGEEKWYLHIPLLFADIIDCKTIWKKKRLLIKLFKRKNEVWPTLDKKPPPKKPEYDDDLDELETDEGKSTKFINKASLPFGDDLDAYVDRAADGNIDIDSKAKWE
ncbi:hypothetical protein TL16_g04287 [Triparma laevis f. inornata]|uniref:CS domain-containing protein n=2 Tax=Triparma laevis TaxID=1534972 RepID=A0A9W6ZLZ0_9STRA|nr:hypothetical protein TrLO_g11419 [Triparma laevis f. longispina]GMH65818.1 hypothetical protein TL16_g04287 [Triparma laevis f. inornata]